MNVWQIISNLQIANVIYLIGTKNSIMPFRDPIMRVALLEEYYLYSYVPLLLSCIHI